ncbi:Rieske (2Fe-2S) protein [Paenibacillus sp. GCM10027626]|uniref:Rieske (2Fe-2S) protein n=1 Tax=Paenibacillus sp. GCM10027626 TaxID=3273411 RepID=UPI00363F075C
MEEQTAWISAGSLQSIKAKGQTIIKGGIAVFYYEDRVYAVDNRCPHMGFPLHMGSLCDGILTCHWHHARFDICSGGTLDPWADDVPSYEVKVEEGEVWVHVRPRTPAGIQRYKERLMEGLQQNIGIVIAKALVGLLEANVPVAEIASIGILHGVRYGSGWNSGLTILTAMARIAPRLDQKGRMLALYQGLVHVARNSSGRSARHLLGALPDANLPMARLAQWYRSCIEVRDTQGAEKVLLTAVRQGVSVEKLADMMLIAATDHFYLDGGHTFDFHNKAFEALQFIDEQYTGDVLAALVPMMGGAARSEELHQWQTPINLVEPVLQAVAELTQGDSGHKAPPPDEQELIAQLLGDQPLQTIAVIKEALLAGTAPAHMAQLVAVAAAERIVRFHTQNDFADWIAVLHTFTYAHAVHESLKHSDEPLLVRAVFHGAMRVYLDRFLNVPAAARPKLSPDSASKPNDTEELLDLLDQRQQVAPAAQWVADYREAGGDDDALWSALGHALLREDAEFHTFQMYEAAVMEYEDWLQREDAFAAEARETMLLACTRYLAAHAPTARELPHTVRIAWRLQRGEKLFEE